jgi:hypothetical protein
MADRVTAALASKITGASAADETTAGGYGSGAPSPAASNSCGAANKAVKIEASLEPTNA